MPVPVAAPPAANEKHATAAIFLKIMLNYEKFLLLLRRYVVGALVFNHSRPRIIRTFFTAKFNNNTS